MSDLSVLLFYCRFLSPLNIVIFFVFVTTVLLIMITTTTTALAVVTTTNNNIVNDNDDIFDTFVGPRPIAICVVLLTSSSCLLSSSF